MADLLKRKWLVASLVCSGAVFLGLLGMRTDLIRTGSGSESDAAKISGRTGESWMSIRQRGRKIGYSHRQVQPADDGFSVKDTTYMRINTMGMVQDLHMRTTAALTPHRTLDRFTFTLRSNLFDFTVSGKRDGEVLDVLVGDQRSQIPMDGDLYLAGGVLDAAASADMAIGETLSFSVFDPTTMGRRQVRVTAVAEEDVKVNGEMVPTRRLELDFMGSSQFAWVAEDGTVVKEQGMMGITLMRVTQQEAFAGLTFSPSEDLTRAVSVPTRVSIAAPESLARLTLAVGGIQQPFALNGDRQTFDGRTLTIVREALPDPAAVSPAPDGGHLSQTPFIESDHPEIRQVVDRILAPEDSPQTRVRKIVTWIHENIEKRPLLSVPTALTTLRQRMGDCNEHAVLLAAMARAAGIPAQIEAGLVYMEGRFYYHAWNALYLDGWVTADALMNQFPADVTHIRFVRGEPRNQVDLMGVIGQVDLEILDASTTERQGKTAHPAENGFAPPAAPYSTEGSET